MRSRISRLNRLDHSQGSVQDDIIPSFRRNRMLSDGTLPRSLSLSGELSRRSSADTIGEFGDNDADSSRLSKRRKREPVISPVESNYSLRGRNKASPLEKSAASFEKPATKSAIVPGIEVSRQDDSISPVSEIASLPDIPATAKQSMRFNFNAKGGGRLIISNAVTPASSAKGSRRPSPASGMPLTEGNTPEDIGASKQPRKLPGRRRNPHKDPKIEAAIRRQAELKKCYRAVSRAIKPMLLELSSRGVGEIEDDTEAHKQYPEYEQAMAVLDHHLANRMAQIDAQRDHGFALAKRKLEHDTEYVLMQNADKMHELQEQSCMQLMHHLISQERVRAYEDDDQMTEDDFDEAIVPLRKPDAYMRSWKNPKARNLHPKYDSRSRKLVITGQNADHLGHMQEFSKALNELIDEMDPEFDDEYGTGSVHGDGEAEDTYPERWLKDYEEKILKLEEEQRNISLLLYAARDEDDPDDKSMSPDIDDFAVLLDAIDIRHSGKRDPITEDEEEDLHDESSVKSPTRVGSQDKTVSASVPTNAPVLGRAHQTIKGPNVVAKTQYSNGTTKPKRGPGRPRKLNAATQRGESESASKRWPGRQGTRAEQAYEKKNSMPTPELAYMDRLKAIRKTPAELQGTLPTSLDWNWMEPEDNVDKLIKLAKYKMDQADQLEYDYFFKIDRQQIRALPHEDEVELRKMYHQHRREDQYLNKSWLQVRQMKLAHLFSQYYGALKTIIGPALKVENERKAATVRDFVDDGKYAFMNIPFEYAALIVSKDKNLATINLWEMAEREIPDDAIHISDRYRFMEMADQVQIFRFSYYYAYWAYYQLCFLGEANEAKPTQVKEDNFRSFIKQQEMPMREREQEWEHAMKTWPEHKAAREQKQQAGKSRSR